MEIEVGGKTYRLERMEPGFKSVCSGCAFDAATCMQVVKSDACINFDAAYVWKEKAGFAFGCDSEARGYGVCEKHCGSNLCVSSQS